MIKTISAIFITLCIIFSVIFGLWANAIISAHSGEWVSWRTYLLSSIFISGFFIFFFSLNDMETKTTKYLTLFFNTIIQTTIFLLLFFLISTIIFIFFKLGYSFINWTVPNVSDFKELIDSESLKNIVLYWWITFLLLFLKFSCEVKL